VWLAANNLEPRLSPFDPLAVLDEIARLVPGYELDRINLFGGNDVHVDPGFVPVSAIAPAAGAALRRRTTRCLLLPRWAASARRSTNWRSTRRMNWRSPRRISGLIA
jgi:hypothetical protein